jgi:hypothetical protein
VFGYLSPKRGVNNKVTVLLEGTGRPKTKIAIQRYPLIAMNKSEHPEGGGNINPHFRTSLIPCPPIHGTNNPLFLISGNSFAKITHEKES